MKSSDYKIGTRLGVSIALLLSLTVAMVGISLWGTQRLEQADKTLTTPCTAPAGARMARRAGLAADGDHVGIPAL